MIILRPFLNPYRIISLYIYIYIYNSLHILFWNFLFGSLSLSLSISPLSLSLSLWLTLFHHSLLYFVFSIQPLFYRMWVYINLLRKLYTHRHIIIIIMSCRQHGYPWLPLATSPYHSSPPAGLHGYILCPHIVAVCKFELVVLLLHGHMWGSIGLHHLWACPCFSSSVPRVWFV